MSNAIQKHPAAMTLVKQRPMHSLFDPFDRFLSGPMGRDLSKFIQTDPPHTSTVRANVSESKDSYKLVLQVPGFAKEDLKLHVEQGLLTVTGEKKDEAPDGGTRWTRQEFEQTSFKRSFRLPDTVQADGISAEQVNGILSVTIPKQVPVTPAVHEININ